MKIEFINDRPIYIQLVEYLKIFIIMGELEPGEKLPSVRDFAVKYQINPNTVQKALQELESELLIYTERTNGKYVTKDTELIKKIKMTIIDEKVDTFLESMNSLGISFKELIDYLKERGDKS